MSPIQRLRPNSSANADSPSAIQQQPQGAAPGKQARTAALGAVQRKADPQAGGEQQAVTPGGEQQASGDEAAQLTIEDVRYEMIAHNFGYQDALGGARGELLQQWGYQPDWASKISDAATGLFVGLLMPQEGRSDIMPILVFRGTEGAADVGDLLSDANPIAVGHDQFHQNRAHIQQLIAEAGGRINVTGHSLGGALAQHCAANFTGAVNQVYTYQAPAIDASKAAQFNDNEDHPDVRHHQAVGDLVDNAGDTHLEGDFFRHDVGGGPLSHVRYLFSTPEFAAQRAELGITDEMMQQLGVDQQATKSPIEHSTEYAEPVMGAVAEVLRRIVGLGVFPVVTGIRSLFRGDDTEIAERIASMDAGEIAGMPVSERSYMVERLCRGVTGNRDEEAILKVLHASQSDAPQVIDVAGAHNLASNMHGDQWDELANFYRASYYPRARQESLVTLIQQCMDGRTSEWEEEMIADILVLRSDGRVIITRLGAIYSGGGFAEGLNKVQWQLDGDDQRRVDAIYARANA